MGDQPVTRPLLKHRTTQAQNKCIHTPNIHALCGIRTHNPDFQVKEDSTCLRPLGYRDRCASYMPSCYGFYAEKGALAFFTFNTHMHTHTLVTN
jgi:hypothetical protein